MSQIESKWQEKITGEWYGCPSVFDGEGTHLGFNKVSRSSVFENGRTTYYMNTDLDVPGKLRARFEAKGFAFGVLDSGQEGINCTKLLVVCFWRNGRWHFCGANYHLQRDVHKTALTWCQRHCFAVTWSVKLTVVGALLKLVIDDWPDQSPMQS